MKVRIDSLIFAINRRLYIDKSLSSLTFSLNFLSLMTTFAHPTCLELFTKCKQNETKNIDLCDEFYRRRCQPRLKIPTVVLVVFILIAVSSFLVNGFMCVVYSLSKEIRTAKHYFMVNLFISNGFIAVFVIPFYLTQTFKRRLENLVSNWISGGRVVLYELDNQYYCNNHGAFRGR